MPDNLTIEDYANPDVLDMKIWRHVYEQKDDMIVRAWKRGQSKSAIGKITGLGRTTAWRVIQRYLENGGD